jgi:hypothetical protein
MVTAKQILLEGFEDLDNGHASFNDPAFADNKTLPIHRWVLWHIPCFSLSYRIWRAKAIRLKAKVSDLALIQ